MKRISISFIVAAVVFIITVGTAHAAVWQNPGNPSQNYVVGDCTMVTTRAEADGTHVYTVNPDHTYNLNAQYFLYWSRNARCDELQFHVDHNTTISRLKTWLGSVATGWYQNIGTTHFKNSTISTLRHEWFFVKDNQIHRIPDLLTALSWGLLDDDRFSVPAPLTDTFYNNVSVGTPLNFNDGPNAAKIRAIWKNGNRDFTSLPARLAAEISAYTYGYSKIFSSCPSSCLNPTDRSCGALMDWRWTYSNAGYQSCPVGGLELDWRMENSETF